MEIKDFAKLLLSRKQTIFSVIFLFLIIATGLTMIQPFYYLAEAKVMIVQKFSIGTDPYTMARSNEYLSSIITNVIPTNAFYKEILETDFNIDKSYFGQEPMIQIAIRGNTVTAKAVNDTGIIHLQVFHKNRNQAEQIMRAISATIQEKHSEYHGAKQEMEIKILNQVSTSNYPVRPNIPLIAGLSIGLGIIASFCYIYLFPVKSKNKDRNKKKQNKIQIKDKQNIKIADTRHAKYKQNKKKEAAENVQNYIAQEK